MMKRIAFLFLVLFCGRAGASDEIPLPRLQFELDATVDCRVSTADPQIVSHLRDQYGVEIVATKEELLKPGAKVKFLPDATDPADGLMQVPSAMWDEARKLLPEFAAEYATSNPAARGTKLLRRVVRLTKTPFTFQEKTFPLYLCPNVGLAYNMTAWPFYIYLKSTYAPADQAKRLTKRDWTDFYMFHEMLHWYTFDQPYLRKWTPFLERFYSQNSAADPDFLAGDVWVPATTATPCRDAYPAIYINMNNFLSHLHMNGLRRLVLEPAAWRYVKNREKTFTGDLKYYGGSMDAVDAMPKAEVRALVREITDSRLPPGCSVLGGALE